MLSTGEEYIYWRGVKEDAVDLFMDDFINGYKNNFFPNLDDNPFLKGALVHLLFVRIHPFT